MARQFLVVGMGRFGSAVAQTLYDLGHEVVAIDAEEAALQEVMNRVTHAAIVDASDEAALKKLGVEHFDSVIVAIGENLEASILATVAAKSAGAKHVISKADKQLTARVLASVGADEIVRPEHDMGRRLARQLATPNIIDTLNLGSDHSVAELEAEGELCGKLRELKLPNRFGVQVIAVNRSGKLEVGPNADFEIKPGDRLVVIGSNAQLAKLREHLS